MWKWDRIAASGRCRKAIFVVAFLVTGTAFAATAQATTYTVGTTSDLTGTCQNPAAGTCSLRQLITYENGISTPATPDTISVPAGTYNLKNGALTITQSLSVVGAGARATTVAQTSTTPDRVFDIQIPPSAAAPSPPSVTISGLKITGGTAGSSNNFFGGDVRNQATLTLSEDWITGGSASSGGGISNDGGDLFVEQTLVSGNAANSGGADSGGIQNIGPNPTNGNAAFLEVADSTIAYNKSTLGGGIFSWCDGTSNACSSNSNGGTNTTDVFNSTIAYNDGGTRSNIGGGLLASQGVMFVEQSIVAYNTVDNPRTGSASNCGATAPGTITSDGDNLETGAGCGFTATGDLQNTNPGFTSTSPQNNGGNTDTFGLSPASPAVDAISQRACGSNSDQRDVPRPEGLACDIGAFELVPTYQANEGGPAFSRQLVPTDCPVIGMQINWGDGASSAGTTSGQGTHTYTEEGTYTGSISWSSDDCGFGSNTSMFTIRVADAALNNAAGVPVKASAGHSFSGPVATFTDADPHGTASDYSATINWGDGTSSPGTVSGTGPFTVNGTHTYAAGGSYPVSVAISDVGGASTAATTTATVAPETQPSLTPTAPLVTSTTSAAFATTVDPEGLATQVSFQYGPALAAARDLPQLRSQAAGPIAYTASTPAQTVAPDYSNHTVTAAVTGLLPNTTYHVRAVATNSAGTAVGPDQTLTTPADPAPPAPVLGKSVDVAPVSGVVYIKLPNGQPLYASDRATGAASALTKGTGFVPLTEARQLPTGTQIDARLGMIQLVAATPTHHKTQSGDFTGGLFGFAQDRRGVSKGLTTLSLLEGAFPGAPSYVSCKAKPTADASSPTAFAAALSSKVLQTLHASAHGRFRTRGRYAAATVRGTAWTTSDRCNGTLISVQRHTVAVTDFVRHITLLVHQGHSYLARAPRARRG